MSDGIRDVFHQYIERVFDNTQLEVIRRSLQWNEGAMKVPVQIDAEFSVDSKGLAKVTIKGTKIAQAIPGWDAAINLAGQMALFSDDGQPELPAAKSVPTLTNSPGAEPAPPPPPDEEERMIPESELEEPDLAPTFDPDLEASDDELSEAAQRRLDAIKAHNAQTLATASKTGAKLSPEAKEALQRQGAKP